MFRYTFKVFFKNAEGADEESSFDITQDTDNLFDARAKLVYQLSRLNGYIFASFTFEPIMFAVRENGVWKEVKTS